MSARIGSLFTGYGGLDMGVSSVIDARTVWVSEIDPAACRVLAARYPGVPNLGDVTATDWADVPPVDVLTGGFPCQDVSTAGARAGLRDGTRSGLWAHMARAIEVLRPRLVVIENVRGLLSAAADSDVESCPWCVGDDPGSVMRALGAVLADLADIGYDAVWHGIRASDLGACHQRFRVFITAYPQDRWLVYREPRVPTGGRERGLATLPTPTASLGTCGGAQDPAKRRAGRHTVHLHDVIEYEFNRYAAAVERHARWIGRPAPPPVDSGSGGRPRLSARFVEWMMCLPDGWVTDIEGVTRTQALAILGNGVIPPQAAHAVEWCLRTAARHDVAPAREVVA